MRFSLVLLLSVFSHGLTQDLAPTQNLRQKLKAGNANDFACDIVAQAEIYNANILVPAVNQTIVNLAVYYDAIEDLITETSNKVDNFIGQVTRAGEASLNIATNFTLASFKFSVAAPIELAAQALGCNLLSRKVKLSLLYPAMSVVMMQLGIEASELPSDFVKQLSKMNENGKMNGNQSKNHMADHKKRGSKKSPHVEE